jgi:hypothetical protein
MQFNDGTRPARSGILLLPKQSRRFSTNDSLQLWDHTSKVLAKMEDFAMARTDSRIALITGANKGIGRLALLPEDGPTGVFSGGRVPLVGR